MAENTTAPFFRKTAPRSRGASCQAAVDAGWEARQAFLDAERAKWLTVEEAAAQLRISVNKMFWLLDKHQVKHFRSGRVIRIHLDDLRAITSDEQNGAATSSR